MQTKGAMERCDCCGRRYFRPYLDTYETDGGYTQHDRYEALPEGWESHLDTGMLCPDCNKEYKEAIEDLKRRHMKPEAADIAEGSEIEKMIPLEQLKRCADLCISLGWSLQDFRKNMDEWEDDVEYV